jgi:glycerol-3-phosphate dehydrogenase
VSEQRDDALGGADGRHFDVAIVGAGINGSVIAASLASHGASVLLVDSRDIAGYTSQASSNMIWGGFKYLEGFDIRLVWSLCGSRNRMVAAYPTNVKPIDFVANLDKDSPHRPWFAYLGTLVYWAFGRFKTRAPRYLTRARLEARASVVNTSNSRGGVVYGDAFLPENDARFVFQFANTASQNGAVVLNHVAAANITHSAKTWSMDLIDQLEHEPAARTVTADVIINAAGPFTGSLNDTIGIQTDNRLALSKGIHLIVNRLTTDDQILVFYDDTGRLFYVLPMGERSSIGTTDTRMDAPTIEVTDDDVVFLLEQINARLDLEEPLTTDDVVSTRGGVRPLVVEASAGDTRSEDWTKLSRKHVVEVNHERKLISVLGGKLTDCLNVGYEMIDYVGEFGVELSTAHDRWFGEPDEATRTASFAGLTGVGFDEATSSRMWRRYGARVEGLIEMVNADSSLSDRVFPFDDLRGCEAIEMGQREMVATIEDLLRRRTMLELTHGRPTLQAAAELDVLANLAFGTDGPAAAKAYRNLA